MTIVRVYWNVRAKQFSVQVKKPGPKGGWRVSHHDVNFYLKDCTFLVYEAGWRRAIQTGVKNVHAYVAGELCAKPNLPPSDDIHYNPFKHSYFYDSQGDEVVYADYVHCGKFGNWVTAWNPRQA